MTSESWLGVASRGSRVALEQALNISANAATIGNFIHTKVAYILGSPRGAMSPRSKIILIEPVLNPIRGGAVILGATAGRMVFDVRVAARESVTGLKTKRARRQASPFAECARAIV